MILTGVNIRALGAVISTSVAGHATVYSFIVPLLLLTSLSQLGVFALAFSSKWVGTFPGDFTLKNMAKVLLNPRY